MAWKIRKSDEYRVQTVSGHLSVAASGRCGAVVRGQLAARVRRGERVLVATLAAGDPVLPLPPLARALHAEWKLDNSCAARREEDRRACNRLGADSLHESLPDAMYRRHPATGEPLYPDLSAVYGRPHPEDAARAEWTEAIRRLPAAEEVVAPLGAGGHVDHRLVRLAAEAVHGDALLYYEDYPYAGKWRAVRREAWPPWRWRARRIALSPEDVEDRLAATAAYVSQTAMLFAGAGNLDAHVRRYVRRVGGERVWRRR